MIPQTYVNVTLQSKIPTPIFIRAISAFLRPMMAWKRLTIEEEEAEERDMILRDAEILSRLVNAKRTTIQLARDALFRKHSQKHAYNEHI